MKIKLEGLVKSEELLPKLLEIKFPIKISFRISRIADKVYQELKTFYKSKQDLLEKYGKREEEKDGKQLFSFEAEQAKLFTKEFEDFLSLEVEIDFEPIKIGELGEINIEPYLLISYIFTE